MNHKYLNRETRRPMYLSDKGKTMHDKSPEADKFIYQGPITAKKQAEEEEAAAANAGKEDKAETDEDVNKHLLGKVKRDVKELTPDEIEELIKKKKIKLTPDETARITPKEDETEDEKEARLKLTEEVLNRKK